MKKFQFTRYSIIQICSIFLLAVSYLLFLQIFVTNELTLGGTRLDFNGYETIFGATKEYSLVYPDAVSEFVKFEGHPFSHFSFLFLSVGALLQFVCIFLRATKKTPAKTIAIINLVSSVLIVFAGIITFFTVGLFDLANSKIGHSEFSALGVDTSATCILMCGLITALNSFDLIKKND